MTVYFFHGEDVATSYQAFLTQTATIKQQRSARLINLDGKELTAGQFLTNTTQQDFFDTPTIVSLQNVFLRPKSRLRDKLIATIKNSKVDICWWEGKKITKTSLKPLGSKAIIKTFDQKQLIWKLLSEYKPINSSSSWAQLYTQALAQLSASSKTRAEISLVGMFLWKTRQLIDIKQNNCHAAPFKIALLKSQADKFTLNQLLTFYQDLVKLDYRAKTGKLKLDAEKELFLRLEKI